MTQIQTQTQVVVNESGLVALSRQLDGVEMGVILSNEEQIEILVDYIRKGVHCYLTAEDSKFFDEVKVNGVFLSLVERENLLYATSILRMTAESLANEWYKDEYVSKYIKGKMRWLEFLASRVIKPCKFFQVNNHRVLETKTAKFKESGCASLVPNYFGHANNTKITTTIGEYLIVEYSRNKKPMNMLPDLIEEIFGVSLTAKTVSEFLNEPQNKLMWLPIREGVTVARKMIETRLSMAKIPYADALWQMDSTPVALMADIHGRLCKTPIVRCTVMDVYSRSFVGVSYGKTENATLIIAALRDALRSTGRAPHLIRYDKGSANMSDEVQGNLREICDVHFPTAAYSPTGKIHIEKAQDLLESQHLRYYNNFAGGNVTRRGTEKTANADVVNLMKKTGKLPTVEETLRQDIEAVRMYNTELKGGESRLGKYFACKKRNWLASSEFQSITWAKKLMEYGQNGIRFQHANREVRYWVGDAMCEDLAFKKLNFGKTFQVRFDPDLVPPEKVLLFDEEGGRLIAEAVLQHAFSHIPSLQKEGEGANLTTMRHQNKTIVDEAIKEHKEMVGRLLDEGIPMYDHFSTKEVSEQREREAIEQQFNMLGGAKSDKVAQKAAKEPKKVVKDAAKTIEKPVKVIEKVVEKPVEAKKNMFLSISKVDMSDFEDD
jgi:transposase InsO family protein/rubrerythrin